MANIYKNKHNHHLYRLEHLIVDIRFADCGARTGIHAYGLYGGPYLSHTKQSCRDAEKDFEPLKYVEDNFEVVGVLTKL